MGPIQAELRSSRLQKHKTCSEAPPTSGQPPHIENVWRRPLWGQKSIIFDWYSLQRESEQERGPVKTPKWYEFYWEEHVAVGEIERYSRSLWNDLVGELHWNIFSTVRVIILPVFLFSTDVKSKSTSDILNQAVNHVHLYATSTQND